VEEGFQIAESGEIVSDGANEVSDAMIATRYNNANRYEAVK
jgi:hypothetical protein